MLSNTFCRIILYDSVSQPAGRDSSEGHEMNLTGHEMTNGTEGKTCSALKEILYHIVNLLFFSMMFHLVKNLLVFDSDASAEAPACSADHTRAAPSSRRLQDEVFISSSLVTLNH